jgi:predicted enzyme related to lactoylglutathione lyase
MPHISVRFVGVGLYFEDLYRAKKFYTETLGIRASDEQVCHDANLGGEVGFISLKRKRQELYPSKDKAVLFFEVPDLETAITGIRQSKVVQKEPDWAVLHDPDGHNVLLLQAGKTRQPGTQTDERERILIGPNEQRPPLQFVGVKLFFDDLDRAREFYAAELGLEIDDEDTGYFVAFRLGTAGFFCLYQRESPADNVILTFHVDDIQAVVTTIGADRFIETHPRFATLEDPEGHIISLVEWP